jgi:glycosyltransferase involved in cell wall biosynthesis
VSSALRDTLLALDVGEPRVEVLRNGVDLAVFRPVEQAEARRQLGLRDSTILLSIGKLDRAKGHDLVVEVLVEMPACRLVIAGEGPFESELRALARRRGVADRVDFLGVVPHARLPLLYCAADALVLASVREGMPNVVLESLACGTPVVASDVGGVSEVLHAGVGRLVDERTPAAFRRAIEALLAARPSTETVRRHAERFAWGPVVGRQIDLYRDIVMARRRAAA